MTLKAPKYVLDASALYPLLLSLKESILEYSGLFTVLDLTLYEVGNTIWKEHRKGRVRNPAKVARLFQEMLGFLPITRMDAGDLGKILDLALRENLTYYDAAYLYAARIKKAKLVTEDRELLEFPESINVEELLKELKTKQGDSSR